MNNRVGIIGIGCTGFRPVTPDVSYRELIFEAAQKAYLEAGLHPKDIDTFVSVTEDFYEGNSIADEYVPDQLGAVLKPVQTVTSDFLQGLGIGYMLIKTGQFKTVAIEGRSKISNVETLDEVKAFALDPIYIRPLKENADFIAGLEMRRFLERTGNTEEQCAAVVVKNRRNALFNPYAGYGAIFTEEDILKSEPISLPLKQLDKAQTADGAVVCVIADEVTAKSLCKTPIWIDGIMWYSENANVWSRCMSEAVYVKLAAKKAYEMAGIKNPLKDTQFAEVCDEYSYKELQHLEALGIAKKGEAGYLTVSGFTSLDGDYPVNPSGGSLGVGHTFELSGGMKVFEAVLQLRGEAGKRQVKNARRGIVQVFRGVPTSTGAVAILSNE
ncbi:MAG: acetyl-CoA acetyltransferase [Deltaproteobacteria bacterium]|nr:acetyl-CoA acetyltransferase [Deltaproteobacteria bacterium]